MVQSLAHHRWRGGRAEDDSGAGGAWGVRAAAVPQSAHHFIVFGEDPDSGALHKIIPGYHQFHAVNAAVGETVRASGMTETGSRFREDAGTYWSGHRRGGKPGDRRAGVVCHTQGSGKIFSMLFFAARVVRPPAMQNPTLM